MLVGAIIDRPELKAVPPWSGGRETAAGYAVQVPLADVAGVVAGPGEDCAYAFFFRRQGQVVGQHAVGQVIACSSPLHPREQPRI